MARRYGAAAVAVVLVVVATLATPAAAAPAVTVTPSTDLLTGQPVTVSVSGLASSHDYVIVDCAVGVGCVPGLAYWRTIGTEAVPLSGAYQPRRVVGTDEDGALTRSVRAVRDIIVPDADGDPVSVSCAVQACVMGIVPLVTEFEEEDGPPLATAPVTFQPTGSYAWPAATATITPRGPLRHRALVDLDGSGFDPDYTYDPIPLWDPDDHVAFVTTCDAQWTTACQWQPGLTSLQRLDPDEVVSLQPDRVDVADDGTIDAVVPVTRFVRLAPYGNEFIDCAQNACSLVVHQPGQTRSTPVPLDVGPEWAPWPSAEAMVDGLAELVGEDRPSADLRRELLDQLATDGEAGSVPNLIWYLANEARNSGAVATLYSALLPSRPDGAGLRYWIDRLEAGASRGRVADVFSNLPIVKAAYADLDDAAFVDAAYTRILKRGADAAGRQYWVDRLAAGMPRYRLLSTVALSAESLLLARNHRIMAASTLALRGRGPTAAEWQVSAPRTGTGEATVDRIFTLVAMSEVFRTPQT